MMFGLTACPHHVEKLIDSVAPPKGYKPSYSTSEVSLNKLKQQTNPATPSTQVSSTQATANDFDPNTLASFPYETSASVQDVMRDSSVFAGMSSGKNFDLKNLDLKKLDPKNLDPRNTDISKSLAGMNLDSITSVFSKTLSEGSLNLDSLKRTFGIDSVAAVGNSPNKINASPKNAEKSARKASETISNKASEKISEKAAEQMKESAIQGATEQASAQAGAFMEKAQKLASAYMAQAQAMMRAKAEQERAEAEAYKRIAEEEERAAKKLAEKPPVMPITVDIRSIGTKRYPDEVELQVAVMDTAGRFITGLAPPHFQGTGNYRAYWRALTDSSSQTPDLNAARVRRFEVTEVREAAQDTHAVAFVLDHSPSMGNTRAQRLQEAVARTLGIVKRQDFISVIKFTRNIKVEVPLTNDTLAYRRGFLMDGLEGYGGGTALYDGAIAGIKELQKAPSSATKIVVLFSDGGDNSSKSKLRDVYQLAKREGVRIFTISYGIYDDIDKMRDLATYTGGKLYQLYSAREFPFAFGDVYKSLKNYYRVRYKPTEAASKHVVQLRLAVPELVSVSTATAEYDRSIFTPLDSVGSVQPVNIEFETGKATIQATSMQQIRDFAAYLQRSPKMVVEIRGHTDDKGADEINQKLSEARADAVRKALVQFGAKESQLRTKGFGKAQPIAPNDSEENRRKNRRTEFAIVEK